jgi:hypothetical protein
MVARTAVGCGKTLRLFTADVPKLSSTPSICELIAMVDSLRQGTLNASQTVLFQRLRNGLMPIAEQENRMEDVNVLFQN